MKSGAFYMLDDRIIIHSQSKSKSGLWLAAEPYFFLMKNAACSEIVDTIIETLKRSKTGVPNPANWSEFNKKHLDGLKMKNWNEIKKKTTKYCCIDLDENLLEFIPTKHDPIAKGAGFIHKENDSIKIPISASKIDLYNALQFALEKCE